MHVDLAAIGLPQYDDLLFGPESIAFHDLGSFNGRRLTLQVARISVDHRTVMALAGITQPRSHS
jgi:hypothetical protein